MQELNISLRPSSEEDEAVLFDLFISAHAHKFVQLGLPDEQLRPLLKVQFDGQKRDFRQRFPEGNFDVIQKNGIVIGQFFISRKPQEITVIDITFLPEHRSGIATQIVRNLQKESRKLGIPILAHVEKENRAWNLWRRLGFRQVGGDDFYWALEYSASAPTP